MRRPLASVTTAPSGVCTPTFVAQSCSTPSVWLSRGLVLVALAIVGLTLIAAPHETTVLVLGNIRSLVASLVALILGATTVVFVVDRLWRNYSRSAAIVGLAVLLAFATNLIYEEMTPFVFGAGIGLSALVVRADIIELKTGQKIEGEVLKDSGGELIVDVGVDVMSAN